MTGTDGNILNQYKFDEFGNQTAKNEGVYNPFRYFGEYNDQEAGLIYLRNRYYNINDGRFISEYAINDGLNWYSYCGGNLVMFVDPWGLTKDGDDRLTQEKKIQ